MSVKFNCEAVSSVPSIDETETLNLSSSGHIKPSLSMTSLLPDELLQQDNELINLKMRQQRPYNSLRKKRNSDLDSRRHSVALWGSGHSHTSCATQYNSAGVMGVGQGKEEFWSALQTNYEFIMDTDLMDMCKEAKGEILESSRCTKKEVGGCVKKELSSMSLMPQGPKDLRKWIEEMNKKVSSFAFSNETKELSAEDLQTIADSYSKLFLEIKSQHRAIMACIKSSKKEESKHVKGLEEKCNLLYLKAFECQVFLEELMKSKASTSSASMHGDWSDTASEDKDDREMNYWSIITSDSEAHADSDVKEVNNMKPEEEDLVNEQHIASDDSSTDEEFWTKVIPHSGANTAKIKVEKDIFENLNLLDEIDFSIENQLPSLSPMPKEEKELRKRIKEMSKKVSTFALSNATKDMNTADLQKLAEAYSKLFEEIKNISGDDASDSMKPRLSMNYSEGYDSDVARRLLEFGEDSLSSDSEFSTTDFGAYINSTMKGDIHENTPEIAAKVIIGSPSTSESSFDSVVTAKMAGTQKRRIAIAHRKLNFEKVGMSQSMYCLGSVAESHIDTRKPFKSISAEITSEEDLDVQQLRPEDFTEIITTCRNNIRCLQAVLQGPPGAVYAANTIRRENGELALLIHVECKCYPITRFIARVFDYIFDVSQFLMNFTLYRFFIGTLRGFYDLLKLKGPSIGRTYRYIMR